MKIYSKTQLTRLGSLITTVVERDSHVIHHIDDNCIAHASVQLDYVVNSSKHINFFRPIVMISTVSYMYNGVCTSTCKGVDSTFAYHIGGKSVVCGGSVHTTFYTVGVHTTLYTMGVHTTCSLPSSLHFYFFQTILVSSSTPFSMPHAINSH